MKRHTFKWRIFKYNIIVIVGLIALATLIFNVSVRLYIKNDIVKQLTNIASVTEETALKQGPHFFPHGGIAPPPMPRDNGGNVSTSMHNERITFYFRLDRSLRETLSMLNSDYLLLDSYKNVINPEIEGYFNIPEELTARITEEFGKLKNPGNDAYLSFNYSGMEYVAIVKSVSDKNNFGLGWIIIFSNLQKVNQLQWGINTILLVILLLSALIVGIFSSLAAKKISEPFSSMNKHIGSIAERNFGTKIHMPVDEELKELVNNINVMSEKLETYDKAQKTFLQNASHEFRTPLMLIQSYAEGIKYEVVDSKSAVDIILDETKRMTCLVEDLLYLSRLDAIEESYSFNDLQASNLLNGCIERMNGIAAKSGVSVYVKLTDEDIKIHADDEKLSRAITNILSNCIRYADSNINLEAEWIAGHGLKIKISDDGPGFEPAELQNVFERFYKGKKGKFGLGLAIAKNVIEKHKGSITAYNTGAGALFVIELPALNSLEA